MSPGLLTAGNGQNWENDLVAALDRPGSGMTVIRRCVDVADVLAAATTGQASVVVLSAGLRRLDTEVVQRLAAAGVAILGIHPAGDERVKAWLTRLGILNLIADDVGAPALLAAARVAVTARTSETPTPPGSAPVGFADPRLALPSADRIPGTPEPAPPADPPPGGRVIAVWGPVGSPGRSAVAGNLAVESAATDVPTLLVDADIYGGVQASAFGLIDESPGLAGACRHAANGRLDLAELTKLVWAIAPNLRLLTGITRADRWPEVRPSAIPTLLNVARSMAPMTFVDCGFCLEADEEITFDTAAPRRNGATLAVLTAADVVLVVGSADPSGMERLTRGLAELKEVLPAVRPRIVLNRVRRTAASIDEARTALSRFSGAAVTAALPEDRPSMDKAWMRGEPLSEVAPSSPLRKALRELASELQPVRTAPPRTAVVSG